MAATTLTAAGPRAADRPNLVRVGTIVWLSSELMFFAALFAIYFTLRGQVPDIWQRDTPLLDVPKSLTNTTILVLSSVTCQMGVFAAERGDVARLRGWFALTYGMGATFIAGQVWEYATLFHDGLSLSTDQFGSAFFLATGFPRAARVRGPVRLPSWSSGGPTRPGGSPTSRPSRRSSCPITGTSSDVVWIALFSAIYLLQ